MKMKKPLRTINLRHVISQTDIVVTQVSVASDTCKTIQLTTIITAQHNQHYKWTGLGSERFTNKLQRAA